jgi:hypothetical protein
MYDHRRIVVLETNTQSEAILCRSCSCRVSAMQHQNASFVIKSVPSENETQQFSRFDNEAHDGNTELIAVSAESIPVVYEVDIQQEEEDLHYNENIDVDFEYDDSSCGPPLMDKVYHFPQEMPSTSYAMDLMDEPPQSPPVLQRQRSRDLAHMHTERTSSPDLVHRSNPSLKPQTKVDKMKLPTRTASTNCQAMEAELMLSKNCTQTLLTVPVADGYVRQFRLSCNKGGTKYYRCSRCDYFSRKHRLKLQSYIKVVADQVLTNLNDVAHHPQCRPIPAMNAIAKDVDRKCRLKVKQSAANPKDSWHEGERMFKKIAADKGVIKSGHCTLS